MSTDGYNPMRWDCVKRGCFNTLRRPKIEQFHDLFPGNINFGDIDAIVEINGNALILEWKSERTTLPRGQEMMYRRLTKSSPLSVLIVVGDANSMEIASLGSFFRGIYQEPVSSTNDELRLSIKNWVLCAQKNFVTAIYPVDISLANLGLDAK
jgi:hypothetical protein